MNFLQDLRVSLYLLVQTSTVGSTILGSHLMNILDNAICVRMDSLQFRGSVYVQRNSLSIRAKIRVSVIFLKAALATFQPTHTIAL